VGRCQDRAKISLAINKLKRRTDLSHPGTSCLPLRYAGFGRYPIGLRYSVVR
jgi:hypothetical protein